VVLFTALSMVKLVIKTTMLMATISNKYLVYFILLYYKKVKKNGYGFEKPYPLMMKDLTGLKTYQV
jgi:hypothetical protein